MNWRSIFIVLALVAFSERAHLQSVGEEEARQHEIAEPELEVSPQDLSSTESEAPSLSSQIVSPEKWPGITLLGNPKTPGDPSTKLSSRNEDDYDRNMKRLVAHFLCHSAGHYNNYGEENIPFLYWETLNYIAQTNHGSLKGTIKGYVYKALLETFSQITGKTHDQLWSNKAFRKMADLMKSGNRDNPTGLVTRLRYADHDESVKGFQNEDYQSKSSPFHKFLAATESSELQSFVRQLDGKEIFPGKSNRDYCQEIALADFEVAGVVVNPENSQQIADSSVPPTEETNARPVPTPVASQEVEAPDSTVPVAHNLSPDEIVSADPQAEQSEEALHNYTGTMARLADQLYADKENQWYIDYLNEKGHFDEHLDNLYTVGWQNTEREKELLLDDYTDAMGRALACSDGDKNSHHGSDLVMAALNWGNKVSRIGRSGNNIFSQGISYRMLDSFLNVCSEKSDDDVEVAQKCVKHVYPAIKNFNKVVWEKISVGIKASDNFAENAHPETGLSARIDEKFSEQFSDKESELWQAIDELVGATAALREDGVLFDCPLSKIGEGHITRIGENGERIREKVETYSALSPQDRGARLTVPRNLASHEGTGRYEPQNEARLTNPILRANPNATPMELLQLVHNPKTLDEFQLIFPGVAKIRQSGVNPKALLTLLQSYHHTFKDGGRRIDLPRTLPNLDHKIGDSQVGHTYLDADRQFDVTLIDYSKPSSQNRFHVFNLLTGQMHMNAQTSHGSSNGVNGPSWSTRRKLGHTSTYARHFSNTVDSHASRRGRFMTYNRYEGKHKLSLRLLGLDRGYNDLIYHPDHTVVVHYASYIKSDGKSSCSMSWGCPALTKTNNRRYIEQMENSGDGGTFGLMYHPSFQPDWLKEYM